MLGELTTLNHLGNNCVGELTTLNQLGYNCVWGANNSESIRE